MTIEELKAEFIKQVKESYHAGVIDTIRNIRRACLEAKEQTGVYPSFETFVNKILPLLENMEETKFNQKLN